MITTPVRMPGEIVKEIKKLSEEEGLEELKKRDIPFRYDLENLEVDLGWVMK